MVTSWDPIMPRSSGSLFFKDASTDGKQDITRITCTYRTRGALDHLHTWNIFECAVLILAVFLFLFYLPGFFPFKDRAIKTALSESELWETKVVSIFTTELSDMDLGKGNEGSLKAIIKSEQKQQKSDTLAPFKPLLSIKPKVLRRFPPFLVTSHLNEPCRALRRVASGKLEMQNI